MAGTLTAVRAARPALSCGVGGGLGTVPGLVPVSRQGSRQGEARTEQRIGTKSLLDGMGVGAGGTLVGERRNWLLETMGVAMRSTSGISTGLPSCATSNSCTAPRLRNPNRTADAP